MCDEISRKIVEENVRLLILKYEKKLDEILEQSGDSPKIKEKIFKEKLINYQKKQNSDIDI